jgi:hypothetical protein
MTPLRQRWDRSLSTLTKEFLDRCETADGAVAS